MKRDIEPGPVLARLDAGRDEIRVEVRYVAGEPFVDVRRWGRSDRGLYPTGRGLLFPFDLAPWVASAVAVALSHRRPDNALGPEPGPSTSPEREPATTARCAQRRGLPKPSHSTRAGGAGEGASS